MIYLMSCTVVPIAHLTVWYVGNAMGSLVYSCNAAELELHTLWQKLSELYPAHPRSLLESLIIISPVEIMVMASMMLLGHKTIANAISYLKLTKLFSQQHEGIK